MISPIQLDQLEQLKFVLLIVLLINVSMMEEHQPEKNVTDVMFPTILLLDVNVLKRKLHSKETSALITVMLVTIMVNSVLSIEITVMIVLLLITSTGELEIVMSVLFKQHGILFKEQLELSMFVVQTVKVIHVDLMDFITQENIVITVFTLIT
jgi:hypothetical protein